MSRVPCGARKALRRSHEEALRNTRANLQTDVFRFCLAIVASECLYKGRSFKMHIETSPVES